MIGIRSTDALRMVVDALVAGTTVQSLVANRVFSGWGQSSDLQTIPKPAIVLVSEGGAMSPQAPTASVLLSVYGVSAVGTDEAMAVYDAAAQILHAEAMCGVTGSSAAGYRGAAWEVQRPEVGWVQDANVWFALGRFNVTVVGA